jgi:hypothetical protein
MGQSALLIQAGSQFPSAPEAGLMAQKALSGHCSSLVHCEAGRQTLLMQTNDESLKRIWHSVSPDSEPPSEPSPHGCTHWRVRGSHT